MKRPHAVFNRPLMTVLTACLAAAGMSCNGGGGGGGGGGGPAVVTGGGITGTGRARGEITAFGSIVVAGVRWEIEEADIFFDDKSGRADDLQLGMVVTVIGERNDDGVTGRAAEVHFERELRGPISAIQDPLGDGSLLLLDVFDRRVQVERGVTGIVDKGTGMSLDPSDLAVDDIVEVSGFRAQDGTIISTFLEREERAAFGRSEVEIKGVVERFEPPGVFHIGRVTVQFDFRGIDTDLSDLPNGVEEGLRVEVEGILVDPFTIDAIKIERDDDDEFVLEDEAEDVKLEGLVTRFNSPSDFEVAGIPVDASQAEFERGRPEDLRLGIRIEVEGRVENGVLVAREVEFEEADARITAEIAAAEDVDPGARMLRLLGIEIHVAPGALLRGPSGPLSLASLGPGDYLEVRGRELEDGSVEALRIELEDEEPDGRDVKLQGRLRAKDAAAGTLDVLGVTVRTNAGTEFEDESDRPLPRDVFFARVRPGDVVKIKDKADGDNTSIDFADEVEFED